MVQILVVDDEPLIRRMIQRSLQGEYGVVCAEDGEVALKHLSGGARPDLILLDLSMPVMDGRAVFAQLRQTAELASIPVIWMSAEAGLDERTEFLGGRPVLEKPFLFSELKRLIESVLAQRPCAA
jgi:CheY-like chemotaxis protein